MDLRESFLKEHGPELLFVGQEHCLLAIFQEWNMVIDTDFFTHFLREQVYLIEVVLGAVDFDEFAKQPRNISEALKKYKIVLDGEVSLLYIERVVGFEQIYSTLHQVDCSLPLNVVPRQYFSTSYWHIVDAFFLISNIIRGAKFISDGVQVTRPIFYATFFQ